MSCRDRGGTVSPPAALALRPAFSACSRNRRTLTWPLLALSIAGGIFVPVADRAAAAEGLGARVATLCASCHRPDGRHTGIPPLGRWEPEELVEKMLAYRSDARANAVMRAVSFSLSDDEVTAVADYLAASGKKAGSP